MKKVIAAVLAIVMSLSLLTGCGKASSASEAGSSTGGADTNAETTFGLTPLPERTTLRVGFLSGVAHGVPFQVADQMGFFDELNIDVEYESFLAGPAMMEASASWDVGDVGAPGVLNGMKNYDVHMIGLCDNEPNNAIFVRPDSELAEDPTNPDLWKGKTIILNQGTMLQYLSTSYLSSIGADINDVQIINMDVTSGLTAFLAGEGDAVCAWNAVAYNADDEGLVRITDMGKLGLDNVVGLCATKDALENKNELVQLAWMVYYLTWEWCQESEENMQKAVEIFVASCEDEGVVADESICERTLEVFRCPSMAQSYADMTTKETDRSGSGEVLSATNLLFTTMDFFIEIGSYTAEDRQAILDKGLVDPSIAEACADTLKELGYIS